MKTTAARHLSFSRSSALNSTGFGARSGALTLTAALLLLWLAAGPGYAAAPAAAPEARGIWVHLTHFNPDPDRGKAEVKAFADRYADAHFNFVLPWVTSDYIAALTDPAYQTNQPTARWDALGELVRCARERHLQVHLWYSFTDYRFARSPDFNPRHGGDPAWAARRVTPPAQAGQSPQVTSPMNDVCPMHPEARAWQLKQVDSLLDRYPGISIHIEEPGYGTTGNCACDLCRSLYRKIHGTDIVDAINSPAAEDFRCLGTTEFIRALRAKLEKRNPRPIFSVNGGPYWSSDRKLGRDWKRWAELGWLDYYASQNYTPNLEFFTRLTQTILKDLQPCPVFIGIGVKWSGGETPMPTVLQEIELARKLGAAGVILFSASAITDSDLAALKAGPFQAPADYPSPQR
ncbi:MAG: family 10 glycosylhydrolase [Verrucomicrobia bacterium]|jgi:uncharacterized lipoprotein YddW (UPF0748 family)|nr:family 10 glycosylhydrolase [Verrucomicrobiota bacterium]OQC26773.1 MAG: hypothetical protein BWX68_00518 [Verrucomicrobia bacterium ADurb.Bin063]HRY58024.1 family 10 glycosylhydrolase [Candidatus Paceibacterota bacterium]MBP8015710.1 family 10 glycosylhydrolase [Verrucomicrobiota bacterium]MDI9371601.1 family 10 glycosylhydrolase [Verrucomicrobiota bacterium]